MHSRLSYQMPMRGFTVYMNKRYKEEWGDSKKRYNMHKLFNHGSEVLTSPKKSGETEVSLPK